MRFFEKPPSTKYLTRICTVHRHPCRVDLFANYFVDRPFRLQILSEHTPGCFNRPAFGAEVTEAVVVEPFSVRSALAKGFMLTHQVPVEIRMNVL